MWLFQELAKTRLFIASSRITVPSTDICESKCLLCVFDVHISKKSFIVRKVDYESLISKGCGVSSRILPVQKLRRRIAHLGSYTFSKAALQMYILGHLVQPQTILSANSSNTLTIHLQSPEGMLTSHLQTITGDTIGTTFVRLGYGTSNEIPAFVRQPGCSRSGWKHPDSEQRGSSPQESNSMGAILSPWARRAKTGIILYREANCFIATKLVKRTD